jgi:GTP cyclohydrolase I
VNEELFKQVETELRKRYYGWEGSKHFEGTSGRLLKMLGDFCWTNEQVKEGIKDCFSDRAKYVDTYDEMLVESPIKVWTLCPHHLLPCELRVSIGYVPRNQVLGLSKFARLAVVMGRRPTIQEMYSRELADAILKELEPKGVGVLVVGKHGCMRCRGVGQDASVISSTLRGVMMDRPEVRAEFLALVNRGGSD